MFDILERSIKTSQVKKAWRVTKITPAIKIKIEEAKETTIIAIKKFQSEVGILAQERARQSNYFLKRLVKRI